MYSVQDNKAIALSIASLRPSKTIKAAPMHLRSPAAQTSLKDNELRRVQGKRIPLELPMRTQNISPDSI